MSEYLLGTLIGIFTLILGKGFDLIIALLKRR